MSDITDTGTEITEILAEIKALRATVESLTTTLGNGLEGLGDITKSLESSPIFKMLGGKRG